jgi:ABC-type branched-subunit amino acid transport system substrate-binding protein
LEGSVFVDGFFADSQDPSVREFVDRYRKRYQSTPTLFAAQAYEAARAVLDAIKQGAATGRAVREHLSKHKDLPTLMGPGGFASNGVLERRLVVVQIKHGKLSQLESP